MYAPKQNQKANTQSNLWQQTATAERVTSDAQSIASIQRDPLVQQTSQMINGPNANAHAGILNLAPANQQSSNQQLLLQWQQQYGNSYVNQVLQLAQQMRGGTSANTTPKPVVQAKLTVNRVGDKYEQEADQVAAQVVQQINAPAVKVSDAKDGAIQREAIPENEKEQDQQPELAADKPKTMPSKLEEDHLVQMKPQGQDTVSGDGRGVTSEMEASIQQAQGKGEPLPDKIRKQMEQAFGADFGGVSIHVDTEADEMNQSLQARAFTVGQDIFFRKGAYDPNSKQGQELLAHELTHVIQQNGSEAQPTADQDMMITKSPQNTGVQRLCSQCDQKKEKGVIQAKEVPGGTPGATVEGETEVSPMSGQVLPKDSDPNASPNTPQSDSSLCPPPPPDSNNGSDCTEKPSACSTGNTGSTPQDGADGETESLPSKSIPKTQPRQTSLPRKNSSNLRPQSRGKVVGSKTIPQNTQATTTDPEAADHPDLENQVEAANRGVVRQKAEATAQALKAQVQLHTINAETSWLTSTEINFALPQQKKTAAREDNSVKQQQQRAIATSMASSFLAQGAMHVQKVTALGQEILVQIQEESKGVVASVKATIEQQKAAVATQMSGQRDQAQSEAEKTIAHIHTRYQVARAAIPQKATKVRQQTETEYAKALFTIDEREREQLDQINKSYVEVCGQCKNVGQMIGAEAVAFGEEKATYWDKQKIHRDDDFWAGPLTDNRLQAKMDAAKKVAAQFKCSLINEANQQADEIQKQKPKDIQIAHTIAEQHRQQAQILQQHSLENLSGVEDQGLSQVTEAQIKLTETANQSLQSTLQFLNQEEAVQLQVLEGYGQRQILAIERDAQKAIASLQNGVNEIAASLQNVLENSIAQFQEMEAPNPEELSVTLANTLQRFDNAVVMVQRQTEKGIATSKFSVIEGGKQAVDAVTAIAQRGVEESATVVEETKTALAHLKKGTTHTFNEIQRGHTKTFTKSIEIAVKGFSQLKEGIQTTFEQYLKPDRFQQSLTSLEEGLRGGIHGYKGQSEECAIKYAADKAADQVQPRWKVALKWIIIILVAIVTIVVMVVFPPGGGLLGALLVGVLIGVVSGIVVQIINNAIDGKKWSDGVGQAALAGAIGGLLGGIGGVVGQAVKIGVNIAKEVVKKALVFAVRFGIDQVFNALGTLVGDLAVAAIDHQPIDWKEIGKDIGIGAAMGVGGEALSGAAHHSLAGGISNRAKVAEFGQKHPGEINELAKLDPKNQEAFDEGVNKVAERTGMKPQEIAELAKLKQVRHAERAIRITKKFDKYRLGRFVKQRAIKIADMHQQVEPHTPADATEVTRTETTTSSEASDRNISTVSRADTDVAGVKRPETEEKAPETTRFSEASDRNISTPSRADADVAGVRRTETEEKAPETTTSSEASDRNISTVSRADAGVAGVKRPETEEKAPETTTSSEASDRNISTVSRADADVAGVKRPETEEKAPETTIHSEPSDRNISTVSRADTDVAGVKRPETEEKAPETTTSSVLKPNTGTPERLQPRQEHKTPAPKDANRVDTSNTFSESVSARETSVQESGFIESDELSLQQIKNEEDHISKHPEIVQGTAPNRRATIGEHEWREEENASQREEENVTSCRYSVSSVCSNDIFSEDDSSLSNPSSDLMIYSDSEESKKVSNYSDRYSDTEGSDTAAELEYTKNQQARQPSNEKYKEEILNTRNLQTQLNKIIEPTTLKTPKTPKTLKTPKKPKKPKKPKTLTQHWLSSINVGERAKIEKGYEADVEMEARFVPQFRGIFYSPEVFTPQTRRQHRKTDEIEEPVYSTAALQEGTKGIEGYYKLLYEAKVQDPKTTQIEKSNKQSELKEYQENTLKPIVKTINDAWEKLSDTELNNTVPHLELIKKMKGNKKQFRPQTMADLARQKYSSDYTNYFKDLEASQQKGSNNILYQGLTNNKNPIVSTGDTPYHAFKYAYGLKQYGLNTLKPEFDSQGQPKHAYLGKVYTSLHDPSEYAPSEGKGEGKARQLRELEKQKRMQLSKVISAERETQFYGGIEKGKVVEQTKAKVPNFTKDYKEVYKIKYGLDKNLFERFQSAIKSTGKSTVESEERSQVVQLLLNYLAAYQDLNTKWNAQAKAHEKKGVMVYKVPGKGYSQYGPNGELIFSGWEKNSSKRRRNESDDSVGKETSMQMAKKQHLSIDVDTDQDIRMDREDSKQADQESIAGSINKSQKPKSDTETPEGNKHTSNSQSQGNLGLLQALTNTQFNTVNIPGDGDCLFSAIAATEINSSADSVRKNIVSELDRLNIIPENNTSHLVVAGNILEVRGRNTYLNQMSQRGVWGGIPELQAYSYHRNLVVVSDTDGILTFVNGQEHNITNHENLQDFIPENPIYLLHSNVNHFSLLRPRE